MIMSGVQAGNDLDPRLAEALKRLSEHGDTSLLVEAAHAIVQEGAIEVFELVREQPDVPTVFAERFLCAEACCDAAWKISIAMLSPIVQDDSFEAQAPGFRARVWETLACSWRKEYERTKSAEAIDNTIDAFQRAVDAADNAANPRSTIYLYNLGTSLIERATVTLEAADLSRARLALKRGLDLCGNDVRMKAAYLAALAELGEH
jgi:hypothetical protein